MASYDPSYSNSALLSIMPGNILPGFSIFNETKHVFAMPLLTKIANKYTIWLGDCLSIIAADSMSLQPETHEKLKKKWKNISPEIFTDLYNGNYKSSKRKNIFYELDRYRQAVRIQKILVILSIFCI